MIPRLHTMNVKKLLDTNVLIKWWHLFRARRRRSLEDTTVEEIMAWADGLIALHKTDAIVTPVFLEMIGGVVNRRELELTRAFLARFRCVDQQITPPADWQEASRLAQRVPRIPRPRDLGDCLIRAIAKRLRYKVVTADTGFPIE